MSKFLLLICFASFLFQNAISQECSTHQSEIIFSIIADQYPGETTWDIKDSEGNLIKNGTAVSDTFCVSDDLCLTFTIYDSFGDGICCEYGNGSYELYYDGSLITSGGAFGESETFIFSCPDGYSCFNPTNIIEGNYTAPHNDFWYTFTPSTTGIYTISTCNDNSCDTKIWVYDYCSGSLNGSSNAGTLYYDDNAGGCGEQAKVTAYLEAENLYYIRIGTDNNSCSEPISWNLSFGGDIEGCTDPESCNYSPFANVDDGSCIFDGDPECEDGPDLLVLENVLRTSLYSDVIFNNTDNCMINEGCLQGFGRREIVRFTTHIKNIGDVDYFIGSPNDNPDQFSFDNCHNHDHYEGYAEYRLANSDNELLPIGFKNGFCVLDLECSDGGSPKYGCGNMGISGHCGDIYSSGLECQWVDVTNLPEGDYTLVVTVNWDQSPDALGNEETDYTNNWAQVCFNLTRDINGNHNVTVLSDCDAYVDCAGTPYGNAEMDCLGNCNGTSLYGDIDENGNQNTIDAEEYIDNIVHGGMSPSSCFDLFVDNQITVYDAALLNSCVIYGGSHNHPNDGNIHDHCNLPGGVTNPTHTVELTILEADFTNQTIDIGINNPLDHIIAYEFDMEGIIIENVTNLVDPQQYPITPSFYSGSTKIIGMSMIDSSITKSNQGFQPLCRIKFSEITGEEICIASITDIVNSEYYKVNDSIVDGCAEILTGIQTLSNILNFSIYPNPSHGAFNLQYTLKQSDNIKIEVVNSLGQIVHQQAINQTLEGNIGIDLINEPSGFYQIKIISNAESIVKKIVISR